MLSDTLDEAVREIERYQRDFPDVYSGLEIPIQIVKLSMQALSAQLWQSNGKFLPLKLERKTECAASAALCQADVEITSEE